MKMIAKEKIETNKRLTWLDGIKVVAMLAVMTVHFNVQISRSFTFPNQIIPSFFFGDIYLGTFGVVLFFIASGCGFEISYKRQHYFSARKFYKKRFLSIYPMFWIAWIFTCCINLFIDKKLSDAPLPTIIYTITGMDGYLHVLLNAPFNFYTIGEWFLGCLILIYLVLPVIHYLFEKKPIFTFIISITISILCRFPFFPEFFSSDVWFLHRIPEVIFGMLLIKYFEKFTFIHSLVSIFVALIIYSMKPFIPNHFYYTVCMCMCIFVLLAGIFSYIRNMQIERWLSSISQVFYPVFLIHQYTIYTMMKFIDPALLRQREIIVLYISYVFIVFICSRYLYEVHKIVTDNVTYLLCRSKPL